MSVKDPDCGTCKTLKLPGGKTVPVGHPFPKALQHHYPVPPLEATSIPVFRGDFDHDGARWRGVITIELEPRPNLVAQGVREMDFAKEMGGLIGMREPAKWVDYDELTIATKKVPPAAKTARPPQKPKAAGVRMTRAEHLAGIDVGDPTNLDYMTFFVINGWYASTGSTPVTTARSESAASTRSSATGNCASNLAVMSRQTGCAGRCATAASRPSPT
jgi:hypothetical protein